MNSRLAFAFAVVLAVSGCSKDKGGGAAPVNPMSVIEGENQTEACDFAPSEGDAAVAETPSDRFVATAFDKEYRGNWLDAIASTSITETWRKILQMARVELYQAADKGPSQCRSFAQLPTMPQDLNNYWQKVLAENEDPKKNSFIAAIYIPQNTQSSIATNRIKSQIILRRNQSRWTLVHEFMHHNFHKRSQDRGKEFTPRHEARLDYLKTVIRFGDFDQARRRRNSETMTEILDQQGAMISEFFTTFDALFVDTKFEEIAIESELRKRYEDGSLKFVPASHYRNAAWYIESSSDYANAFYQQRLLPMLNLFYSEATTLGHPSAQQLGEVSALLQQHLGEAQRLKREHPLSRSDRLTLLSELEAARGDKDRSAILNGSSPCGHDNGNRSWELIQSAWDQVSL